MKPGTILAIMGLLVGGVVLCTVISNLSRDQCARDCPSNAKALYAVFELPKVELWMCDCKR
jgi:hypothetical protein